MLNIQTMSFMIKRRLLGYYYKYIIIPKRYESIHKKLLSLHINNINNTVKELIKSNKSLSRFGDGEFRWILGVKHTHSFEKSSKELSHKLIKVLQNTNDKLMVGLPDGFVSNKYFVSNAQLFWEQFCSKYGNKLLSLLDFHKNYYSTDVSRPYISYNTNFIAKKTFPLWKKVWDNKKLLVVEGTGSRIGLKDDLLNNANCVKRIECPSIDAFESYSKILDHVLSFLKVNKNYITLLSLGPTATILASDLCNKGFRAIDIGHIDLEYEWFIKGVKEKTNLPYKYVNEVPNGNHALPVYDKTFKKQIIYRI